MEPNDFEARRRAVRISASSDVDALFKIQDKILGRVKILDMSTLGIGVQLEEDPGNVRISVQFKSPEVLAGLSIVAHIRRKNIVQENGRNLYHLGLEYEFSSADQQNILLRWLAFYLQKEVHSKIGVTSDFRMPNKKDSGTPANLEIRFPRTMEELEQCYYLIQPLNVHHALIQTKIFLLMHAHQVTALVPLMVDTLPFKLPLDRYFPEYVEKLRRENRRIGEVAIPKFNENSDILKAHPSMILRKLHILFSIFLHMLIYSKQFAQLTDLLVLAPLQYQEFFRLWLFQDLRDEVDTGVLRQWEELAEHRFMRLDLTDIVAKFDAKRPELLAQLRMFETSPSMLSNFQDSCFPTKDFFEKWFVKKRQTLNKLSEDQKTYFRQLVPDVQL